MHTVTARNVPDIAKTISPAFPAFSPANFDIATTAANTASNPATAAMPRPTSVELSFPIFLMAVTIRIRDADMPTIIRPAFAAFSPTLRDAFIRIRNEPNITTIPSIPF